MLSKNKIKFIRSLDTKKGRFEAGVFVLEGEKLAGELLHSEFDIHLIAATEEWYAKHRETNFSRCREKIVATQDELNKTSFLKTPQPVICLAALPQQKITFPSLSNKLTLVLDSVQDPGNLGTIIRIADWYGIEHIVCSRETADAYNPKVVQATMGAILRVKIVYEDLVPFITSAKKAGLPIFGTTLNGENIYKTSLSTSGLIVMGNESKGISESLQQLLTQQLFIPFYPEDTQRSESLNVAVASAIICAEFRRREMVQGLGTRDWKK